VGHGDGEAEAVAQLLLELVFPGPASGSIATSGIRQNEQMLSAGITATALLLPPARRRETQANAEVS
jgi:hypothetical protein